MLAPVLAHADPCPTTAIVRGDKAVREALAARGIETTPRAGCPVTVIEATSTDAGIELVIVDAGGRRRETRVADLATAISVVESWTRPDLEGSLLEARPARVAVRDLDVPVVLVAPAQTRDVRTLRVSFGPETAIGADRSLWFGLAGRACVRLGAACGGAMARLSQDSEVSGDSEAMQTSRRAFELGVLVDVPRDHGWWSWTPGAFLGLALEQSRYAPENPVAGTLPELDGGSLRGGVHVGVSAGLGSHWFLGADVALDVSLVAPADAPDPGAATLAGPPRSFLRGALELRYEGL